ncbi:N-(5'-phosphoribosyl)anthranilate isomerase [Cytophagales bacterium WSM2-2]|nr:N-(5'-phosphoribosyl)anthranilate isomerase [Cytophagales bacterium WSM2-2]
MENNFRIKVCGMRDPDNIMDVAALNPDFMGFIFYSQSQRYVGENFAIPGDFPKHIKRVGVFVDEKPYKIVQLIEKHKLDFVQLHGDESQYDCELLRIKAKVIKSFRIDPQFNFNVTREFNSSADFFLFDTKGNGHGGIGKTFDWGLLKKYDKRTPFFLGGGLSVENIGQVNELKDSNLFSVDINSRAEIEPGLKDVNVLNTMFQILNQPSHEIHG